MARFRSLVFLTLLSLPLAACDGGIRAGGTAADSMGRPVPDALVFLDYSARKDYPSLFERRTGSDGHFELSSTVAPGRYDIRLVVQASGYREASLPVRTLRANTIDVKLEREGSDISSRITLLSSKEY